MSESAPQPVFTRIRILTLITALIIVLGLVSAFLTSGHPVVETPPVVAEEAPVVAPETVLEEAPVVAPETVVVPVSEENPTPAVEIPAPTK